MIVTARNDGPLIVSIPHAGLEIPADIAPSLVSLNRARYDADLYIDLLYAFAFQLGATIVRTTTSRTVIDVNRDPSGATLYPGQFTTGLCPTTRFDGGPVYLDGQAPGPDEVAERVDRWWRPYHEALAGELADLRARHGRALLWDGHSIASRLPWLFEGELPELNLGTAEGRSCRPATQARVVEALAGQSRFSWVANGRFKGGYITRHYGRPEDGVEALQLETAQRAYMAEPAGPFEPARAAPLQALLVDLLGGLLREPGPGR